MRARRGEEADVLRGDLLVRMTRAMKSGNCNAAPSSKVDASGFKVVSAACAKLLTSICHLSHLYLEAVYGFERKYHTSVYAASGN